MTQSPSPVGSNLGSPAPTPVEPISEAMLKAMMEVQRSFPGLVAEQDVVAGLNPVPVAVQGGLPAWVAPKAPAPPVDGEQNDDNNSGGATTQPPSSSGASSANPSAINQPATASSAFQTNGSRPGGGGGGGGGGGSGGGGGGGGAGGGGGGFFRPDGVGPDHKGRMPDDDLYG